MANVNMRSVKKLSIATTLVDAALAFARGRYKRGLMLLGAAALSARAPGLGTAVSLLSRVVDRVRKSRSAP